jgi:hypothetical protein
MNKFIGEKTKLECKEGMLMHPFLDNSGLVFFNTLSTVVTSISVNEAVFKQWLDYPQRLSKEDLSKLRTLIDQGFLVESQASE